jgi:hypothetical protein
MNPLNVTIKRAFPVLAPTKASLYPLVYRSNFPDPAKIYSEFHFYYLCSISEGIKKHLKIKPLSNTKHPTKGLVA